MAANVYKHSRTKDWQVHDWKPVKSCAHTMPIGYFATSILWNNMANRVPFLVHQITLLLSAPFQLQLPVEMGLPHLASWQHPGTISPQNVPQRTHATNSPTWKSNWTFLYTRWYAQAICQREMFLATNKCDCMQVWAVTWDQLGLHPLMYLWSRHI